MMTLSAQFKREIGLKSLTPVGLFVLGIKVMKEFLWIPSH
jgi:hypothetical protein